MVYLKYFPFMLKPRHVHALASIIYLYLIRKQSQCSNQY